MSQKPCEFQKDTVFYVWGKGYSTSTITFYRQTKTFYYLSMEDIWVHTSYGSYSIKNDTIYLKCTTNCEHQGVPTPVILSKNIRNQKNNNITFLSTTEDTLKDFTAEFYMTDTLIELENNGSVEKKLLRVKVIDLWKDGNSIYKKTILDTTANNYTVYIPYAYEYPESVYFKEKEIVFREGFLIIDNRKFVLGKTAEPPNKRKCKKKR